jgi:uncharacterized membrane protein
MSILYLGDTSLGTAACYLAGVLQHAGHTVAYRPSHHTLQATDLTEDCRLVILSDYPAAQVSAELQAELVQRCRNGLSLLMIGGWESFCGLGGDWQKSRVAELLPVVISNTDDRRNLDCVSVIQPVVTLDHPILRGLPWHERPPLIGGYNRVSARAEALTLLDVVTYRPRWTNSQLQLEPSGRDPLLVIGQDDNRRTACLMTDLAPHWVGPLVDWGTERVQAKYPGAEAIEVGSYYARFITQLIDWLLQPSH